MTTTDIDALVNQKLTELLARPESWGWSACASIWAHEFVLASPAWRRWPNFFATVREALSDALLRCVDPGVILVADPLLEALEGFDVEDDGSPEWQFAVDLIAMISTALGGQELSICLETAVRSYLEGIFNVLGNTYAVAAGRPISQVETIKRLVSDTEWNRAVIFIRGL